MQYRGSTQHNSFISDVHTAMSDMYLYAAASQNLVQGLQLPGKPYSFVYSFFEACACAKSVRTSASATSGSVNCRKLATKAIRNTILSTPSKTDVAMTS